MTFLTLYLIYATLGFICAMYTALSSNWNIDHEHDFRPKIDDFLGVIFIILLTGPIIPIYNFIYDFVNEFIKKRNVKKMFEIASYNVQIWVGTREGYSEKFHTCELPQPEGRGFRLN